VGVAADADDTVEHGFIKVGSRYRQIDAPGSITTNAFRINNWGVVVGSYVDADGADHGFILACADED